MENVTFVMLRDDLRDVPRRPLPDGYVLRPYGDGGRAAWIRIWSAADGATADGATFDREFGGRIDAMPRRSIFLVSPDGREVGTVTAWFARHRGRRYGKLHWVAIHPDHQGRGMGGCLVSAGLERLRELGHRRALLRTQTFRLAAIRTYLDFGFVPEAEEVRALLRERLDHPALDAAP
jgi:GNAT superfamily N-acetyltransferase